ncbi:hypothetical protein Ljor_0238 [Legionella jordanis]|uniref:Uncharacterized protein n=1 Tax=Legionella jordanis TaxID=456 RepID=A0A0W0VFX8_9GAMM|nr:hypothetical protein [Legionella jordanis]KTD19015.1 hypothetical protein Ljor_0238 [Legionella jordanis]VEH13117.1 Uncharacterised protein [Legionella jordanis]
MTQYEFSQFLMLASQIFYLRKDEDKGAENIVLKKEQSPVKPLPITSLYLELKKAF